MISRRNYFTITIVMFIVFFLFQFSNVALETWNHYEENSYIVDTADLSNRSDAYHAQAGDREEDFAGELRETVVYIGEEDGPVGETVALWATYAKKSIKTYQSLEDYEAGKETDETDAPVMVAVDSSKLDWGQENGCDLLEGYLQSGVHLVFCNLPEVSVLKADSKLQELLGVQMIRAEEMTVEEIHLYEGFLLGGEAYYPADGMEEGMEYTLPWYVVSSDSEIYMNGITKKKAVGDESIQDDEMPAIIWRRDAGTASVFVVNGSYMDTAAGLGILSAMSAKMSPYEIYPVVNARNMIYANYPGMADENEEILMEHYSQSMKGFFQNVVWPDVVAIRRESGASLSCMLAPQFDYEDSDYPDTEQFQRYMKLLNEQSAETGLSGMCLSDTPIEKKVARDSEFMQDALPTYRFTSFYAGNLTEEEVRNALSEDLLASVRTVVEDCSENKEVIGYLSEYITRQSAVIDGWEDSVRKDFQVRALETVLGYNSILVDMSGIVYPEEGSADWVDASSTVRRNIQDYRIAEQGFDHTTVSECDERIRSFLALDYKQSREFNSIYLELNDSEKPVWFVLRTDNETIESMDGGSWKQIEDDAYLVEIEQKNAVITLKAVY